MKKSTLFKLFAVLVAVMLVAVAIFHTRKPGTLETVEDAPAAVKTLDDSATVTPAASGMLQPKPVLDLASGAGERPKLPSEQVEAWLQLHGRDAVSLLAAFRAMGDSNYLNEAAANFPNDPKVEWTVLAQDEFPADRRKWLELFKRSAPDNAVACYLSAEDYFKNGKSDDALRELDAASDKSGFDNHENESRQDNENLYAYLGKTKLEAAQLSLAAMSDEQTPMLAVFKRVAQGMAAMQKKALAAGDLDSVDTIYENGSTLVENLQNGDGGDYVVSQLFGIAVQNILLDPLNQNTSYEFLDDQTPAQVLQEFKDQKNSITKQLKIFNDIYPSLTPEEMLDYTERVKDDGELQAMQWIVQQHPPASR